MTQLPPPKGKMTPEPLGGKAPPPPPASSGPPEAPVFSFEDSKKRLLSNPFLSEPDKNLILSHLEEVFSAPAFLEAKARKEMAGILGTKVSPELEEQIVKGVVESQTAIEKAKKARELLETFSGRGADYFRPALFLAQDADLAFQITFGKVPPKEAKAAFYSQILGIEKDWALKNMDRVEKDLLFSNPQEVQEWWKNREVEQGAPAHVIAQNLLADLDRAPSEEAKVQKLSQLFQIPAEVIRRDLKRYTTLSEVEELLKQQLPPAFRNWVAHPENAALARDSLDVFKKVRGLLIATKPGLSGEKDRLKTSFLNMGLQFARGLARAGAVIGETVTKASPLLGPLGGEKGLAEFGKTLKELGERRAGEYGALMLDLPLPRNLLRDTIVGGGQMGLFVAMSAIDPALPLLVMGGSEGGDVYYEAKKRGAPFLGALAAGIGVGYLNALIEDLQVRQAIGIAGGMKHIFGRASTRAVKNILGAAGREGLEEFLQGIVHEAGLQSATGQFSWKGLVKAGEEGAYEGVIATLSSLLFAAPRIRGLVGLRIEEEARVKAIQEAQKLIEQAPITQNAPERASEGFQALLEGTGNEASTIDAEAVEAYFQGLEGGQELKRVFLQKLGVDEDTFVKALQQGGEIEFGTGKWLAEIGTTEVGRALFNQLRPGGGLSMREIQDLVGHLEGAATELAKTLEELITVKDPTPAQLLRIQSDLVEKGGYRPEEASMVVTLAKAGFRRLAEIQGKSLEKLVEEVNPKVVFRGTGPVLTTEEGSIPVPPGTKVSAIQRVARDSEGNVLLFTPLTAGEGFALVERASEGEASVLLLGPEGISLTEDEVGRAILRDAAGALGKSEEDLLKTLESSRPSKEALGALAKSLRDWGASYGIVVSDGKEKILAPEENVLPAEAGFQLSQIPMGSIRMDTSDEGILTYHQKKFPEADIEREKFRTVKGRLNDEWNITFALLGVKAEDQPEFYDKKGNWVGGYTTRFYDFVRRTVKEGLWDELADPKISVKTLVERRGLKYVPEAAKGKKRGELSNYQKYVEAFRKENFVLEAALAEEQGKPYKRKGKLRVLSENAKTKASINLPLFTCRPTEACHVCYAAGIRRMGAEMKSLKTLIYIFQDKTRFAEEVVHDLKKWSLEDLPFLRFLGSGDMMHPEVAAAFNEVAKRADRPLHIFSRHHRNLRKLKAYSWKAPWLKMASIDHGLMKYYPMDFLKENHELGIMNVYLMTSASEIEEMKDLIRNNALHLIFPSRAELFTSLPEGKADAEDPAERANMKEMVCMCDAGLRHFCSSCKTCFLSFSGCMMGFSHFLVDKKGKLWRWNDPDAPELFSPFQFLRGKVRAKAYAEVAADIVRKSRSLITNRINEVKKGKFKSIVLRDLRYPEGGYRVWLKERVPEGFQVPNQNDVVLPTNEAIARAREFQNRLDATVKKIRETGSFDVPFKGEKDLIVYEDWKPKVSPETFYQAGELPPGRKWKGNKIKGKVQFFPQVTLITLFKGADKSTLLHEFGHIFLHQAEQMAQAGTLPPDLARGLDALWKATDGDVEKAVRSWEAYLLQGKAPSVELTPAFFTFSRWLTRIYGTARGILGSEDLDPEVRSFFDMLLATEHDLKDAEELYTAAEGMSERVKGKISEKKPEKGVVPVEEGTKPKESRIPSGMEEGYEKAKREFHEKKEKGLKDLLEERVKLWYRAQGGKKGVKRIVQEEVRGLPLYGALAEIQKFRGIPEELILGLPDGQEIIDELRAVHGKAIIRALPKGKYKIPRLTLDEIKKIVQSHGYKSFQDFLGEARRGPSFAEQVKRSIQLKEGQIRATFEDLLTKEPGALPEDVLFSEEHLAFALADAQLLAAKIGQVQRARAMRARKFALKVQAQKALSEMPLRDAVRFDKYLTRMASLSKQAFRLLKTGKLEEALKAKEEEIDFLIFAKEAIRIRKERDKILRRYQARRLKLKNVKGEFRTTIQDIVGTWRLSKTAKPILDRETQDLLLPKEELPLEDELRWANPEWEAVIPRWILERSVPASYVGPNDLSFNMLLDLDSTLQYLLKLGRGALSALKELHYQTLQELVEDSVQHLQGLPPMRAEDDRKITAKAKRWSKLFFQTLLIPEFLLEEADGSPLLRREEIGPLHHLFNRLSQAESEFRIRYREIMEKGIHGKPGLLAHFEALAEERKKFPERFEIEGVPVPELIQVERGRTTWDFDMLLAALLNTGNADNLTLLTAEGIETLGFTPEQIEILRSKLSAKGWRAIQGIWDLLDSLYPDLARVKKRLLDQDLEKVEAQPFTVRTSDGQMLHLRGGYYPLYYDPQLSLRHATDKERENFLMEMRRMAVLTPGAKPQGRASNERVRDEAGMAAARRPIWLSTMVLDLHLQDTLRYITHAELLQVTDRLMRDKAWREMFISRFGKSKYALLRKWLSFQALPKRPSTNQLSKMVEWARRLHVTASLGLRVSTGIKQRLSLASGLNAMNQAGSEAVRFWLQGVRIVGWNGNLLGRMPNQIRERTHELSRYMAARETAWDRDIRDFGERNISSKSVLRGKVMKFLGGPMRDFFFAWIKMNDAATVYPIWWGAFRQAQEQHLNGIQPGMPVAEVEKRAVEYADTIVRTSQPSALPLDLAEIQRANEFSKLFSSFWTWRGKAGNRLMWFEKAYAQGKISKGTLFKHYFVEWFTPMFVWLLPGFLLFGDDKDPKAVNLLWDPLEAALFGWIPYVSQLEKIATKGDFFARFPGAEGAMRFYQAQQKLIKGKTLEGAYGLFRSAEWFAGLPLDNIPVEVIKELKALED